MTYNGNGRSHAVKKNIIWSFFIRGISVVVSLMLVPATIDYVSPELYGVWLALASTMAWLSFADIGFTQGLKNRLTEALANEDFYKGKSLVSTTYFLMFIIFIPICIVLEVVVPFVNWTELLNVDSQYSAEITNVMHVLVAFACIQMIVNVLVSVIAAFQKVALSNSFLVIGNVFSLIIIYILRAFCPPSLIALAFSISAMPILITIIATLILFCGKLKKIAPSIRMVQFGCVRDLFGLGYKFFIINIQALVLYQSTNILIANVSTPLDVTNYNIAYKLMNCAMMVYNIITAPLWPAYTDAYAKKDFLWMKEIRMKMTNILLLSIMGCAVMVVLSDIIYKVWIGDEINVPFSMTILVSIYVSIYCWVMLNGTIIVGIGKVKLNTYIVVVGMIVHIPLSLYLGTMLGSYGVLLSMICINIMYGFVYHIQTNRLLNNTATGIWNQ